jgi:hypothetical protein
MKKSKQIDDRSWILDIFNIGWGRDKFIDKCNYPDDSYLKIRKIWLKHWSKYREGIENYHSFPRYMYNKGLRINGCHKNWI